MCIAYQFHYIQGTLFLFLSNKYCLEGLAPIQSLLIPLLSSHASSTCAWGSCCLIIPHLCACWFCVSALQTYHDPTIALIGGQQSASGLIYWHWTKITSDHVVIYLVTGLDRLSSLSALRFVRLLQSLLLKLSSFSSKSRTTISGRALTIEAGAWMTSLFSLVAVDVALTKSFLFLRIIIIIILKSSNQRLDMIFLSLSFFLFSVFFF